MKFDIKEDQHYFAWLKRLPRRAQALLLSVAGGLVLLLVLLIYARVAYRGVPALLSQKEALLQVSRTVLEDYLLTANGSQPGNCPWVPACGLPPQGTISDPAFANQVVNRSLITVKAPFPYSQCDTLSSHPLLCALDPLLQSFQTSAALDLAMRWTYVGSSDALWAYWPALPFTGDTSTQDQCEAYDPRFRPWFASAASGRKAVVFLIDISDRMYASGAYDLLIAAMSKMIDTLSNGDVFVVVPFAETPTSLNGFCLGPWCDRFQPVTSRNREKTKAALPTAGGIFHIRTPDSSYLPALERAADLLAGQEDECEKVTVIMTDGKGTPPAFIPDGVGRIFSFAIGTDLLNTASLKEMACATDGMYSLIAAPEQVGDAMARWYLLFSAGVAELGPDPVTGQDLSMRWSDVYTDALGLGRMVSVSAPVFDRSVVPPEFKGVIATDVLMSEFPFWGMGMEDTLRDRASVCTRVEVAAETLELLRPTEGKCLTPQNVTAVQALLNDTIIRVDEIADVLEAALASPGESWCVVEDSCYTEFEDLTCTRTSFSKEIPVDLVDGAVKLRNGGSTPANHTDPWWKLNCDGLAGVLPLWTANLDESPLSWQYWADQNRGTMSIYPGFRWDRDAANWPQCAQYDPRFRPWYAAAASVPKNVILMLDTSGSMREAGKLQLAKEAAAAVLKTLSFHDYFNIIDFDSSSSSYGGGLLQATTLNKNLVLDFINDADASGGTDFIKAFSSVFDILDASEERATTCENVILFLTDGAGIDPSEIFDERDEKYNTIVFSYSLGEEAAVDIPFALACAHRGIFYKIDNPEDLAEVMAQFFTYFSPALEVPGPLGERLVAFSESYIDALGLGLMTTASTPIFENGKFVAVVGVDITLDVVTSQASFEDIFDQLQLTGGECKTTSYSEGELNALRPMEYQCPPV